MEFYKTLKGIASHAPKALAIGLVAALPYVCDSCGYSGKKASAAEIRPETSITENIQAQETETLEAVVEK